MPAIDLEEKVDVFTRLLIQKNKDNLVQFININIQEYLKDLETTITEDDVAKVKGDIKLFLCKLKSKFLIEYSFDHLLGDNKLHLHLAILFPLKDETRVFTYITSFKK